MYNSFQIANFFLKSGQDTGTEITPMKLIKLCYIAHGWYLGFNNEPLLTETVYAWKYGPVIDTLYDEFKEYGSTPIKELYTTAPFEDKPPMAGKDVEEFLTAIWRGYGKFDGVQLSAMTHQRGTPWYRVWNEEGGKDKRHVPIPNNYIEEHYKQKIEEIRNKQAPQQGAAEPVPA
jgi:uncharacterized phage-associated protein